VRADKQSNTPLGTVVQVERMKGREPRMTTLIAILERLLDGEKSDEALQLLAEHGLPTMMLNAQKAGLLNASHWEAWKARMGPLEAEMVLGTKEEVTWPHEVKEWAAVIAVSGR
jgi:hypothetical protein